MGFWRQSIPGRGTSKSKVPELGTSLTCSRNSKIEAWQNQAELTFSIEVGLERHGGQVRQGPANSTDSELRESSLKVLSREVTSSDTVMYFLFFPLHSGCSLEN